MRLPSLDCQRLTARALPDALLHSRSASNWDDPVDAGFIGLGMMGRPMALNLIKAGFTLSVYDVAPVAVAELAGQGARPSATPAELSKHADVVLTALPTLHAVEDVYLGPGGLIESARTGQILIDHSTVSPALSRTIAT